MAQGKTLPFSKFLIKLGNGQEVEVFTAPCGFTSRGITFSAETVDTIVPDCDDEDKVVMTDREKSSRSCELSGSGVVDTDDLSVWRGWDEDDSPKNVEIIVDKALADGGGQWSGSFHLTSFQITGERKGKITFEATMVSAGAVNWTDAGA